MSGRNGAPPAAAIHGIVAAVIGNLLEWFDILIYGYLTPVIAALFFPAFDRTAGILMAWGTFGAAFVARPLGAVMLGRYADLEGRRAGLVLVIALMFLGTAIIVVTPTYATIGVAAPILLLTARLIQGFSAGGEFGTATAFLAEQVPARRCFYASWQFASQGFAMLLAASCGYGLTALLEPAAIANWGWRVPFSLGLLVGPVAYYFRRRIDEPPAAVGAGHGDGAPFDWRGFLKGVAIGIALVMPATIGVYLLVYMPSYAQTYLGLASVGVYGSSVIAGLVIFCASPLTGLAGDRLGTRSPALIAATLLMAMSPISFLALVAHPSVGALVMVQALLALIVSAYLGVLPAMLADLFERRFRTTGIAIAYNVAVMTGGGFAPLIFTLLISRSGDVASPGYYLAAGAALALVTLLSGGRAFVETPGRAVGSR